MMPRVCGWLATICVLLAPRAPAAEALQVYMDPDCPAPQETVTFIALPRGGFAFTDAAPLSVQIQGSTIKVVAAASGSYFPELTGSIEATLNPLPVGDYRMDFYIRYIEASGALGPETFVESKPFRVQENPPTCAARGIETVGSPYRIASPGADYREPIRLRVTDAHGYPVEGATVHFDRVPDVVGGLSPPLLPDLRPRLVSALTDAHGMVEVSTTANDGVGVFQYRAWLMLPFRDRVRRYIIFYQAPQGSSLPDYPVVEFRRAAQSGHLHFFMTGNFAEMAKLDDLGYEQWVRTGAVLMAYAPGHVVQGTTPVCRYYGLPSAGLDSHFFSVSPAECAEVAARFPDAWMLETDEAFRAYLPDVVTGACPAGTTPVYRAFNNQPDANHRYALTSVIAMWNTQTTTEPLWTLEGYGPNVVAMCAPQ